MGRVNQGREMVVPVGQQAPVDAAFGALLVEVGQVVFSRPRGYLVGLPVGAAVAVSVASISLLEKPLVSRLSS